MKLIISLIMSISIWNAFADNHFSIPDEFKKFKLVPDLISKAPTEEIEVDFGRLIVDFGNTLTPTEVRNPPTHISWVNEKNSLYTLIMTDPDAPSRDHPTQREWRHWMVINIPEDNVKRGDVLAEYIGSGPNKGSGLHRYTFLVYKQQSKITNEHDHLNSLTDTGRANFSTEKFAAKHKLQLVAGNFFLAEWDESVIKLQEGWAKNRKG